MTWMIKDKTFTKSAVFVACIAFFLMGCTWTVMPVLGNILIGAPNFLLTPSQYSIFGFVLMGSAIFSSYFTGVIGHKYGMRCLILSFLITLAVANTIYSLILVVRSRQVFELLLIAQVLLGVSIGGLITSFSSYLPLLVGNKIPIVLAGVYSCTNLGSLTYPLFFTYFLENSSWIVLNFIISLVAIVLFIFAIKQLPDKMNVETTPKLLCSLKRVSANFWLFILLAFSYGFVESTIDSWGVIYLHQVSGVSIGRANLGLSFFWGVVAISQLLICFLLRWIKSELIYRILPLVIFIGYVGLFLKSSVDRSVFFFMLCGIGCSSFFSLSVSFVEMRFKSIAEIASGFMVISYFMGGAFCALAFGGMLKLVSMNQLLFLSGGVFVVILLVVANKLVFYEKRC